MKTIKFAIGFAAGYVLGAWAGREKYEQIVAAVNRAVDHAPAAVQTPTPSAPAKSTGVAPKRPRTQATVTAPSVPPETVPDL